MRCASLAAVGRSGGRRVAIGSVGALLYAHFLLYAYLNRAPLSVVLHAPATGAPTPPPAAIQEHAEPHDHEVIAIQAHAEPADLVAVDSANCAASGSHSCSACLRIRARKQPNDSGVRCVWCSSPAGCRGYVKGTREWPCSDAIRSGGGYPGGSRCVKGGRTARLAQASATMVATSSAATPRASSSALLLSAPVLAAAAAVDEDLAKGATVDEELAKGAAADELPRVESLWLAQPATRVEDSFPIGNGQLGALVYGRPWQDALILNEESLFAGPPPSRAAHDAFTRGLEERADAGRAMRRHMADGDARGAEAAAAKLPLGKVHSYEFLGTLGLRLSASGAELGARADVVEYRRVLDLESAIATVRFQSGACT